MKKKIFINAIICGLGIFHIIDIIFKIPHVINWTITVTITTTNIIRSTAPPILVLEIAILIYLIFALIKVCKEGKEKLWLYLVGAGVYSSIIIIDHLYRYSRGMYDINFGGALIICCPVIIGAILLSFFVRLMSVEDESSFQAFNDGLISSEDRKIGQNPTSEEIIENKMIRELSPAENNIFFDYKRMVKSNDNLNTKDILAKLVKKHDLNLKFIRNAIEKGNKFQ